MRPILLDIMTIRDRPLVVRRIPLKGDCGKIIGVSHVSLELLRSGESVLASHELH